MRWYADLARENPQIVKFVPSIGESYEGRNQPAVHITMADNPSKKIYFQCQIHARKAKIKPTSICKNIKLMFENG